MKRDALWIISAVVIVLATIAAFTLLTGCEFPGPPPDKDDPGYFVGTWTDADCRSHGGNPIYDDQGHSWCKQGRADPEGPEAGQSPSHGADGGLP